MRAGSTAEPAGSARGQRRRLVEAMETTAATHGYGGATVSRVVELAGVSRTTFYEHFRDREECFLAAYLTAVGTAERICAGACDEDSLDAALASLLGAADADPDLARLLLIECLAGPRRVRVAHDRLLKRVEQAVATEGRFGLRLPPGALHGGLTAVLSSALLDRGEEPLARLLPALSAWLRCYEAPPGAKPWSEGEWSRLGEELVTRLPEPPVQERPGPTGDGSRTVLPRGRSAAPPSLTAEDRRRRILEATAELVAAKGYAAASIAEIVAAARVTRGAFYSHFDGKLDAFLEALKRSLQESVAAAAGPFALGATWPERVWDGLHAFLRYTGERPEASYLGMVEIYAAGAPALRRAAQNRSAFTLFLAEGYQQNERAAALPALCSDAVAGAIEGVLRRQLQAGEGHRALELLPHCAYLALAPFIGCAAAAELVTAKSQGDRSAARTA